MQIIKKIEHHELLYSFEFLALCYNYSTKRRDYMIKYIKGDMFSSPAQVLVNTVNLDGVMGKGIALKFKQLYPDMFNKYQTYCEKKLLEIGKLWIYKSETKWILNFPTKVHWRNPSKVEYIEKGLQKFVDTYKEKEITSIAFPKLGCGNGGLEWEIVKPIMDKYLKNLPIDIYVYEDQYSTGKEFKNTKEMKNWLSQYPKDLSYLEFKTDVEEIANSEQIVLNIDDEQFSEFWDILKNTGFITPKDFNNPTLFKLSSKLDYVLPCQISNGLNGSTLNALQLRLPASGDTLWQTQMNI